MTSNTHTMRQQFAAQSVIEELLKQQSSAPPQSSFARFFGRSPLGADSVAWHAGAKGEIAVGSLLAQLPPDWTVFHALPIGTRGSDIDHLVIGPGGIFTINTKHHNGKRIWIGKRSMMVAGQKVPHIRNAEFEADRVTKLLRERMPLLAPVQPMIAIVAPSQITVREAPERVKVIDARHLRRWLTKRPAILTESETAAVAGIIDSPATWGAQPSREPEDLMAQFSALDADVRSARTRRVLWKLLGAGTTLGAGVAVLPNLLSALMALFAGAVG